MLHSNRMYGLIIARLNNCKIVCFCPILLRFGQPVCGASSNALPQLSPGTENEHDAQGHLNRSYLQKGIKDCLHEKSKLCIACNRGEISAFFAVVC